MATGDERRDGGRASWGRYLLGRVLALAAAAAIVAGAAGAVALLKERADSAKAVDRSQPALTVRAAPVRYEDGYERIERYVGRIAPRRSSELAFERGGLVLEVAVDTGDAVDGGALIARLDTQELIAERARLEAELRRLEAERALALRTTSRQGALAGQGFASDQRFDEARFRAEALAAQMDAVRAQLRLRDIDLEKSSLRAPFDGVVGRRDVDEGAVVAPGTRVARLQETSRLEARIGVPPVVAARLTPGAALTLQLDGGPAPARLRRIAPDLDPSARTVELILDLEAAPAAPAPMGEIVRFESRRRIAERGAWLPLTALQEGRDGLWSVATLNPDGAGAHRVGEEAVELLHVAGERAYVRGTLADGAQVIAVGLKRVVRGQRVRLAEPAR